MRWHVRWRTRWRAIEGLPLDAARAMIEQRRHLLEVIARETGVRDRRPVREAFVRGRAILPATMRRDIRIAA